MATRRQVLAGILGSGALVTAAAGLAWFEVGYGLLPGETPIAFSRKEFVVVRRLVQALLPGGGTIPSGTDLGVPQRIDEEVWATREAVRKDLKAGLLLLEHGPVLLAFPGRFSSLALHHRQACLRAMLASNTDAFVQVVTAYRQMAYLFYYSDDRSYPGIGYDGRWVKVDRPAPADLAYAKLLAQRRHT